MENKSGKIIAIVALAVAVVALSVGFAAFADSLNITGNASVNATTSSNPFDEGTGQANGLRYTGSPSCVYQGTSDSAGNNGTFTNDNDSWTGISVALGEAATVVCTATVTNSSAYQARLTGIEFSGPITVTSSGDNSATNVTNVTAATTVTVTITDSNSGTDTATVGSQAGTTNASHVVVPANGGTATVTVTIAYAGATTDEDATITLPTITHHYTSA